MKQVVSCRVLAGCLGLSALLPTAAYATPITSPTSATASSTFSPTYSINNTINHSGLSIPFVNGVTDFDAYLALNPTHTLVADFNEWFTAEGVTSATVTYDLGSALTIDRLALWNEEFSGFGTARISTSLDNSVYTFLTSISPLDSPGGSDYGAQVFAFGPVSAEFVRFEVSGCPQPDGDPRSLCGIGEVAFSTGATASAVPEPATLTLTFLGLGASGLIRRRRNGTRA